MAQLIKYSIGIDISKGDFKACIGLMDAEQHFSVKASSTFSNTEKGFDKFLQWSEKNIKHDIPVFFVMEATGVYHEQLAWHLFMKGEKVSIVLANKAKRYFQSLGLKSKTDKIDAFGLAMMGAEQKLQVWAPISKEIYHLRSLTRLHEELTKQVTAFRNRLHATERSMYAFKDIEKSIESTIKVMEKEVLKLEAKIEAIIKEDSQLNAKYELVKPIKGIGLFSFAVIVAETNGFEMISSIKQLTSYAGYDVVFNQSGIKNGKTRISKKGNNRIRRIMHMPALNAVKYEPKYSALFMRIYERSKIKMKGYVAVQKKLLTLVYTLWKHNEVYQRIEPLAV